MDNERATYWERCDACGEPLPEHGGYVNSEGQACNKGCLQELIDGTREDRAPRVGEHQGGQDDE